VSTRYEVTFHTTLTVIVLVDADDEDRAADAAWQQAEEYAQTLGGNYRDVRAEATFDGIGADEVEALTGAP
jgi:hypothetical protein